MTDVAVVSCVDYTEENVDNALKEVLYAINGLDEIKAGMKVAIKVNLVAGAKPEKAVTTHPQMICSLSKLLLEKGAEVIVGDSPGGLYTAAYVNGVYSVSGLKAVEKAGAKLNRDFSEKTAEFPEGAVLKDFKYTAWLDSADVIINFAKLKTHGMMGMSSAAKNMFGAIPGTIKPEYHFRFPDYDKFADMLIDIDEYFKPVLNIVDAVTGMEGNGPTMGTPRHIGCIIASKNPHKADMVCAQILGIENEKLPTLVCAKKRGLCPENINDLDIYGNYKDFYIPDYQNIAHSASIVFERGKPGIISNTMSGIIRFAIKSKPVLKKSECVGCRVCENICPAKAIVMKKGKAQINRKECIACFCCQEFCPKGAMKSKRPFIAKMLEKI
ncbi:MAG: DUF362 domain-containing protein [Clostridia bacterium]|nr:DUF362 domain-containing protein [Clostridia bacterium]